MYVFSESGRVAGRACRRGSRIQAVTGGQVMDASNEGQRASHSLSWGPKELYLRQIEVPSVVNLSLSEQLFETNNNQVG